MELTQTWEHELVLFTLENQIRRYSLALHGWMLLTGKLKQKHKKANSKSHARELIKEMIREGDEHGFESLDYNRITFPHLADHYEKSYLTEALIVEGRKVSGLRSLKTPKMRKSESASSDVKKNYAYRPCVTHQSAS